MTGKMINAKLPEAHTAKIFSENTAIAMLVLRYSMQPTAIILDALGLIARHAVVHDETASTVELHLSAIEHILLSRDYGRELIPKEWQ